MGSPPILRQILVYIAGPISRGDLRANVRAGCEAGLRLMKAGLSVIVPHASCYFGQVYNGSGCIPEVLPAGTTHADWYGIDLVIVSKCNAVLRLPGESVGADLETAEARRLGIPVFHDETELLAWALSKSQEVS